MSNKKYTRYHVPQEKWGECITYTYEKEDGTMWIGNHEYESQVNFCPVTGKPAQKQMQFVKTVEFELNEKETTSYYE